MKKEQKKSNGTLAVALTVVICAVFIIAMLFIFFFGDMIAGHVKLSNALEEIEDSELIVINDPLYKADILITGAEVTLRGDEAEAFGERFARIVVRKSYQRVIKSDNGFWDIRLSFSDDGRIYNVYMKEDSVYIAEDGKGYEFAVKSQTEYKELYAQINQMIADSAK